MQQSKRQTDNPQVTQLEVGWLAGILDGEGTITITTGSEKQACLRPMVNIANSNEAIVEKVVSLYETLGIQHHVSANQNNRVFNLGVVKEIQIAKLLPVVYPSLVRLCPHAKLMARFVLKRLQRTFLREWDEETIQYAVDIISQNGDKKGTVSRVLAMAPRLLDRASKSIYPLDKEAFWGTSETIRGELVDLLQAMI